MIGGFQPRAFQPAYQQVSAAPAAITPPTGGWPIEQDFYLKGLEEARRRRRLLESADVETQALPPVERQIAAFLHEQEKNDLERADSERLLALARQWSDSEELSQRVREAMARVIQAQTYGAIQALMRELERSAEEEDIAALMLILNQ